MSLPMFGCRVRRKEKKMIMYKEIGNYILHLLNSILKKYYGKNRNNIKIQ